MSRHGAQRAGKKGLGPSGYEALNPKKINQWGKKLIISNEILNFTVFVTLSFV